MNDELTPREHSDMRDSIVAGAQRIHSAGQRRMQMIAGAVALVLVAGISGGAVATATLVDSRIDDGPVSTPTPTETAEPSPTATPADPTPTTPPTPASPPEGVVPFGGECANTLTDEEVEGVTGIDMARSDYRWRTGANAVLGGIDCVWVSQGVYLAATTHFYAYPERVVPPAIREVASGCVSAEGDASAVECTATGTFDGTWMLVRATGSGEAVGETGVDRLLASAAARQATFAPPAPALRTEDWWALPDCDALVAGIDPAVYGYERVTLAEQQSATWYADDLPQAIPLKAGATHWCDLHFTSGSGDTSTGEVVNVSVVPGGAIDFPTVVEAQHAQPVTVDGAQAAATVPGLDRYEGSPGVLVISDGVNILMVTPDLIRDTADAVPLAAVLLGLMQQ